MNYVCKACRERVKDWNGSDPRCAFTGHGQTFVGDNWSCATMTRLRDLVYEGQELPAGVDYQYCDDQKYATVRIDDVELDGERIGMALWVSWYKSRGETEAVWVLDVGTVPRAPTEAEVLAVVGYYDALKASKAAQDSAAQRVA